MARISIRRCRSASSKRSDNPKLFPARPTLKSAVHGWGGVFGTNLRAALVARLTCIGCGPDAFVPEFVFTPDRLKGKRREREFCRSHVTIRV